MGKKISHEKVLIIDSILQRWGSSVEPFFAYSVSQNRTSLEPIISAIQAAQKRAPEFDKFEEERAKLLQKHAKKDANGTPIQHVTNYNNGLSGVVYDIEDRDALEKDVKALKELKEFSGVVDAEDARRIKLEELMKTEVKIPVFKIKMSDAPKGVVTGNDMAILTPIGMLEFDLPREQKQDEGAKE